MNEDFAVLTFIENRWAEARQELAKKDPGFIRTVEAHDYVVGQGLLLPQTIPTPSRHLPARWHQVLETTMEIIRELERLQLTVSLAEPDPNSKETPQTGRQIGWYFFEMWVQNAHNLCDKVKLLVTHCCRLYQLGGSKVGYQQEITAKLQGRLGKLRQPLVHGAGGQETIAHLAITVENQGWEVSVAQGPAIINEIMRGAYEQGDSRKVYFERLEKLTDLLLYRLAQTLYQLDQEINRAKTGPPSS